MAHVELHHRFAPGTLCKLHEVSRLMRRQLRPMGPPLETAVVGDDGVVRFDAVLATGTLCLVSGLLDGQPYVATCRAATEDAIVPQPCKPDRPRQVVAPGGAPTAQSVGRLTQEDIPGDVPQASDTATGEAAPLS